MLCTVHQCWYLRFPRWHFNPHPRYIHCAIKDWAGNKLNQDSKHSVIVARQWNLKSQCSPVIWILTGQGVVWSGFRCKSNLELTCEQVVSFVLDVLSVVGSSRHVKNRYSILSGEFHQYLWRWGNINNRTGEELSVWQSGCSKWWWRHRGAAWEREIDVFTRGNVNIQSTCAPSQSIFLISSHQ